MRAPILKAVSAPPRLFWAPFLPAAANMAMQMPFMFIGMGLWKLNPIFFIPSILLVHLFLIIYGAKEPHLSKMMASYGPMAKPSLNIYKEKGNKLAP